MGEHVNELNEILEKFYKLFYESEDLALKNGIKCLTHTELHIIEAIGSDALTMNELSNRLAITMGTATVAVTKLGEKGFVSRIRSDQDRRKVYVSLSKKGIQALGYHDNYHKNIISTITDNIDKKEIKNFIGTFESLLENLRNKSELLKPLPLTDFDRGTKVSIVDIKGTPIIQDYFANRGVELYCIVEVLPGSNDNNLVIKKEDGMTLELNILDAKNLIAVKADK